MEPIFKYEFRDLSQEVKQKVIEGHTEYLKLTEKHRYTYEEILEDLNNGKTVFDVNGNVVID